MLGYGPRTTVLMETKFEQDVSIPCYRRANMPGSAHWSLVFIGSRIGRRLEDVKLCHHSYVISPKWKKKYLFGDFVAPGYVTTIHKITEDEGL